MSFQAQNWVITYSKQKGSALLVLLMIANHAHSDGTNAFPSIKTLAKECRLSERQITRIVGQLEQSGELLIERSIGRTVHNYSISMILNPDKMSLSNPVKMSGLSLTNPTPNPDKSGNPTLTNRVGTEIALNNRNEPFIEPLINRVNHARENADFFPQCEPAKIFTEIYGFTLPIHTETILAEEQISAPDLWRQILTDAKAGMTSAQLESANYVGRQIQYALKDYRRDVGKLTNGAKQNGQFKSAREKSNQTAIENYAFLDELDNFANSQESELYGKNSADYKLLT